MAAGRLVHLLLSWARAPWPSLLVAACLLGCLVGCNGLFYHPYRGVYAWPDQPHRSVRIPTEDGLELDGLWLAARGEPLGTVVQFHGNAGNVTSHFLSLRWVTEHGLSLLAFDYRGYGRSPGRPSAAGLEADARAAIRYAQRMPHGSWGVSDVVLIGQSLGGAVLLSTYGKLADRHRVRAVVTEGTFHSYTEVAASVLWQSGVLLPFAGFAYALISDAHSPASLIARVSPTPLLVVHGTRDRIVPPAFAHAVYGLAREPRELWLVPGAGHLRVFTKRHEQERLIRYLHAQR